MIIAEIDTFQVFVNLLNFLVPAVLVFGITYYLMEKFLKEQRLNRILELKKEQSKGLTPIKLQAYERLTIFLDRISPDNLVIRLSKKGQSANQLRSELIHTITSEFNHNISQQIYISNDAWNMIVNVKEQIINVVETSYSECAEEETGPGLGKIILTKLMNNKSIPTQKAIELLKNEIEIAL